VNLDPGLAERLKFLCRVVPRELEHLASTDARFFVEPFSVERAEALCLNVDDAERVEAFVGRLQDTLGDKFLPAYLSAVGEPVAASVVIILIELNALA
jgi:hypothetical protein